MLVITAGTAGAPVADECELALRSFGFAPRSMRDVGVAGLHRLLAHVDDIAAADGIVVVSGDGGRTRQRRRRPDECCRRAPCRRARATAPRSTVSPRCWR
ncbi:MAG: hypothetical protein WKF58_15345 [Ilumatobacteraceae bacterium]